MVGFVGFRGERESIDEMLTEKWRKLKRRRGREGKMEDSSEDEIAFGDDLLIFSPCLPPAVISIDFDNLPDPIYTLKHILSRSSHYIHP